MEKREVGRQRFIAIVATVIVIILLIVIGLVSEDVLYSEESIRGVGVILPENGSSSTGEETLANESQEVG